MDRKDFLKNAIFSGAALGFTTQIPYSDELTTIDNKKTKNGNGPEIVDTNINLFEWPFRNLKYSNTQDVVKKLSKHKITQAWAGSFESLFLENIDRVNKRLYDECKEHSNHKVKLRPIGTVNIRRPDWRGVLKRCHEKYNMKGIRIYPSLQMMKLDSPEFKELVQRVTERNMFIQIMGRLQDHRNFHPAVRIVDFKFDPLVNVAKQIPKAKIQLLDWSPKVNSELLKKIINETNIVFDTSVLRGAAALGQLLSGSGPNAWDSYDETIPADRLLFGSYMPFYIVESAILVLYESTLKKSQFRSIVSKNANRFLAN